MVTIKPAPDLKDVVQQALQRALAERQTISAQEERAATVTEMVATAVPDADPALVERVKDLVESSLREQEETDRAAEAEVEAAREAARAKAFEGHTHEWSKPDADGRVSCTTVTDGMPCHMQDVPAAFVEEGDAQ